MFTPVYPTAWQLIFWCGALLMGQQNRCAVKQNRVNPWPAAISNPVQRAVPISFDAEIFHHCAPLVLRPWPYI